METLHKVKWQVSLTNGETLFEGKGDFKEIRGQSSPWQRLTKYIIENSLDITSLSLYTDDGRTFNLPSKGKNPKFREFSLMDKPLDFNFAHKLARNIMKDGTSIESGWFTFIEAIYPTYRLQLWVDENDTRNCWVLSLPNGS